MEEFSEAGGDSRPPIATIDDLLDRLRPDFDDLRLLARRSRPMVEKRHRTDCQWQYEGETKRAKLEEEMSESPCEEDVLTTTQFHQEMLTVDNAFRKRVYTVDPPPSFAQICATLHHCHNFSFPKNVVVDEAALDTLATLQHHFAFLEMPHVAASVPLPKLVASLMTCTRERAVVFICVHGAEADFSMLVTGLERMAEVAMNVEEYFLGEVMEMQFQFDRFSLNVRPA